MFYHNIFLIFLFSLSISTQQTIETIIVPGNWVTSNSTISCKDNLISSNKIWKLNILNDNTAEIQQGNFSYFLQNGTAIWGVCQAQNSSLAYGIITTIFSCNTSHSLFDNAKSEVLVQWDTYNSMAISLNITQTFTTSNENGTNTTENNCSLYGTNVTTYSEYVTWNVTTCVCGPCCYDINTPLIVSGTADILNYHAINIIGTISGPYCENTMVATDHCALISTVLENDYDPSYNVTTISCDYIGYGMVTTMTFRQGILTIDWGSCQLTAELPVVVGNTWGEYLRNGRILLVILFILYGLA